MKQKKKPISKETIHLFISPDSKTKQNKRERENKTHCQRNKNLNAQFARKEESEHRFLSG